MLWLHVEYIIIITKFNRLSTCGIILCLDTNTLQKEVRHGSSFSSSTNASIFFSILTLAFFLLRCQPHSPRNITSWSSISKDPAATQNHAAVLNCWTLGNQDRITGKAAFEKAKIRHQLYRTCHRLYWGLYDC